MTVLELRFPAGRFHATPWGHHVNEGVVEWPPSPWRILRSLISIWHLKARTAVFDKTIRDLIAALATRTPHYHLPKVMTGHTRHYMPMIEGKNKKTTKVFDTFIQLAPEDVIRVAWEITLSSDQFAGFQVLAERLNYFGRAESLVEARVRNDVVQINANSFPIADGEDIPDNKEFVRLLSPLPGADYEKWLMGFLPKKTYPTKPSNNITGKTPPDKIKQPEVPIDVFAALHADTGKLKIAGWNLPPGATWVNYVRPDNACALVPRVPHLAKKNKPTVARYAVAGIVLPRITEAISIANRVHDALCKWSDQGAGPTSVFTGIGAEGKPLAGHRHAHIFCESNGLHDAITHITVWAEMGFDNRDCVALHCLNKIWGHGGHDIRLVLTSLDQPETFPDCKLFGTSKLWRSATPFVPTRHAKTFHDGRPKVDEANGCQIGSAAHDLLRLIAINLKTTGVSIRQNKTTTIGEPPNAHLMHFLHQFQTTRHGGKGCRSHDHGGLFTITFVEKVTGPLAFGYGAHFSLGLFLPIMDSPGQFHQ